MDLFKKKSLNFSHEQFSRDKRHAETLRARESSRFKRLSMVRSINDSDFLEDNSVGTKVQEHAAIPVSEEVINKQLESSSSVKVSLKTPHEDDDNSLEISAERNGKKPLSRLEMLKKWKEEKLAKQELEKKLKKKPFTVGVTAKQTLMKGSIAKPPSYLKSSFINQSTMKFNSSIMGRSRIAHPSSPAKPPKPASNTKLPYSSSSFKLPKPASNTKLAAPSSSIQPSRVPYNFKAAYSASKPVSGTIKAPNTMLRKPTANVAPSVVTANKFASAARTVNTVNKFVTTRSTPVTGMIKPLKISGTSIKTPNQESALPKTNLSRALNKPTQKVCSALPKPTSTIPKGIPVRPQNQAPVPSIKKKPDSIKAPIKPVVKDVPKPAKMIPPRSNLVFKKAAVLKVPEPTANLKKGSQNKEISQKPEAKLENKKIPKSFTETVSEESFENKRDFKNSSKEAVSGKSLENYKDIKNSTKETVSDKSTESIPDVALNCDVSVIKPSASFAPMDFKFEAPVMNFIFDDDDPWDALHVVKRYLSRTSTPSKDISDRTSGACAKEIKSSIGKNPVLEDAKNKEILFDNTPDKSCRMNPNFKFSLSGDFLGMESPGILLNNEIMDDLDGECNKSQEHADEIASCKIPTNKPGYKEIKSTSLEKEAAVEKISKDSCMNEITENSHYKSLVLENEFELNDSMTKGNSAKVPFASPLISEGIDEMAPEKPLINEYSDKIDLVQPLLSEVSDELRPSNSLMCDSVPSRTLAVGEIAAQSLLKEVQDVIVSVGTENKVLKDKPVELMLMQIEEEEENGDVSEKLEIVNLPERKSTGSSLKRVSMLKSVSVLNAIAETSELDQSNVSSPAKSSKKLQNTGTPRRSIRLSTSRKSEIADDLKKSPVEKENDLISISVTPRRSTRLHKRIPGISENESIDVFSPFKDKRFGLLNTTPRRSMRLINLNTPEENAEASCSATNITADFSKMKLSSKNVDTNDLLLDLENSPVAVRKPKKISLLYSPDRRKSIRKSIKGDLMSFSPSGN